MEIEDSAIREVTETVWTSVLGLPLQRADVPTPPSPERGLIACVCISGAWEGAVTLESSRAMVRRAAAILLGVAEDAATPDDLRDTLGEIANIIGGNIKGLLPEPSLLSIPAVAEGHDWHALVPGSRPLSAVGFSCEGQPLRITLHQRAETRAR